ncbi:stress responsive alpha-beta barrel [Lewinellaceae bacterium SD302]|nr:stress responsive alpha-beta barrel [Lewinellaceae bacterium SD302]
MEPGLIHNVYFWLKEDITEAETKRFIAGLKSLETVETVERMFLGRPANTENRDVVDNSFDYSLQLWFKDQAGQDTYQTHPTHLEFVELQDLWTKVVVRDNVKL